MGTTANYVLRYPELADSPNVALDLQKVAQDVDSFIMSIPIGMSFEWDYGAAAIPSWCLLQYGQAISRTTYSALHALASAASYPHGAGDGSSTFNISDKRGRITVGKDDMGGTAANRITAALSGTAGTVLGAAVGVEGVTLATAQIPSHDHTSVTAQNSAVHNHGANSGGRNQGHTHGDYGHGHSPAVRAYAGDGWIGWGSGWFSAGGDDRQSSGYGGQWMYSNWGYASLATENYDHAHHTDFGGISANETHSIPAEGGGGAHLNTQPTIIVNQIVRAI